MIYYCYWGYIIFLYRYLVNFIKMGMRLFLSAVLIHIAGNIIDGYFGRVSSRLQRTKTVEKEIYDRQGTKELIPNNSFGSRVMQQTAAKALLEMRTITLQPATNCTSHNIKFLLIHLNRQT